MQNGIYKATFAVGDGWGQGIVTLHDGMLTGGDAGFTYFGTYQAAGVSITGELRVAQHDASVPNVFAGLTAFDLTFSGGELANSMAKLTGKTTSAPGATLTIDLTMLTAI